MSKEPWTQIEKQLIEGGYSPNDVAAARSAAIGAVNMQYYLQHGVLNCTRCHLVDQCTGPVTGTGSTSSPVMIVGEAPGEHEDTYGVPLVGASGQLLTLILQKLGVDRSKVYITNAVKCRPEGNRALTIEEIDTCGANHLLKEIEFIQPKVIITLGNPAMWALRPEQNKLKISQERGVWHMYDESHLIHTYHPSYLLRLDGDDLTSAKTELWKDIKAAFARADKLLDQEGLTPNYYLPEETADAS